MPSVMQATRNTKRSAGRGHSMTSLLRVVRTVGLLCLVPVTYACGQMQAPAIGGVSSLPGGTSHPKAPQANGAITAIPDDFAQARLAPGYLLTMTVYDMPEISGDLRVDNDGDVTVPMAGNLHVGGMTLPEARAAIEQSLVSAQILKNPKINLDITQYASSQVTVLGEVETPGRIPMLAPHSLPDVLAMVGGETVTAGATVEIRHPVNGQYELKTVDYARSKNTPAAEDIVVHPGDTVTVPRAGIVYVLGAVNRPGGYVMQEDGRLSVTEALSMAYGTAINAAVGSIRIIHKQPDGTLTQTEVPYRAMLKGKVTSPMLSAQDVVYVPVSKVKTVLSAGVVASTSTALIYTLR